MAQENLIRMIKLADEAFGMRQEPEQISVDKKVRARLLKIHPAALSKKRTKKGPIAWVLIFPTTTNLMSQFIKRKISEKDLLFKTPFGIKYDSIYLCSALVLPEYRRKGIAKRLMCRAINTMQKKHPIKSLFYWGFSKEGKKLAKMVAGELALPLYKRRVK